MRLLHQKKGNPTPRKQISGALPLAVIEKSEDYLADIKYRIAHARKLDQENRRMLLAKIKTIEDLIEQGDIDEVEKECLRLNSMEADLLIPFEKPIWRYYVDSLLVAIIIALIIRSFVMEAFRIPSGSMIPSLLVGDHVFANKLAYNLRLPFSDHVLWHWATPQPGDVIVFRYPQKAAEKFQLLNSDAMGCFSATDFADDQAVIKRVIALPGDKVELRKDQLFVNGKPVRQSFIRENKSGDVRFPVNDIIRETLPNGRSHIFQSQGHPKSMAERTVPPGMLFVLGDNRDNSSDSRCWGWVPFDHVIGKAFFIWLSVSQEGKWRFHRLGFLSKNTNL